MYNPTTRLLTILEILQARGQITGAELAERLEVEPRSIRRYIGLLRDMGIPIEGERGRNGAYSLSYGYRLPPLMFHEDEILAVVLGLMVVRQMAVAQRGGIESALSKIERVLPLALQQRAQALQETLIFKFYSCDVPPPAATVGVVSQAAFEQKTLLICYQSAKGEATERMVDPYGIALSEGMLYTAGFCHLRRELRVFRLDRILSTRLTNQSFVRPENFDVLNCVQDSIAMLSSDWLVEVWLDTTMDEARRLFPAGMAMLEDRGTGVVVRCTTNNLAWMAHFLLRIPCAFRIEEPDELRQLTRAAAKKVLAMVQ